MSNKNVPVGVINGIDFDDRIDREKVRVRDHIDGATQFYNLVSILNAITEFYIGLTDPIPAVSPRNNITFK